MYVGQHHHVDHELLRWILLIVLACALILLSARTTNGEYLPKIVTENAPNAAPAIDLLDGLPDKPDTIKPDTMPTADQLWRILDDHRNNRHVEAIRQWNAFELDGPTEAWRAIATGKAYIQLDRLDRAEATLNDATKRGSANAVTHHLLGVVNFMQANRARLGLRATEAYEHQTEARIHFVKAIERSCEVEPDQLLSGPETRLVAHFQTETIHPFEMLPPSAPRVEDLLEALDLTDFERKSRLGLIELDLALGRLADAESQLDTVTTLGEQMGPFYLTLGDEYAKRGDRLAATRAYLRSIPNSEHKASAALRALRRIRN